MEHRNWQCPKCDTGSYEKGRFSAVGGGLSRFFNFQNKKFSTVTCRRCRFTEIYKTSPGKLESFFDLLSGG